MYLFTTYGIMPIYGYIDDKIEKKKLKDMCKTPFLRCLADYI